MDFSEYTNLIAEISINEMNIYSIFNQACAHFIKVTKTVCLHVCMFVCLSTHVSYIANFQDSEI